MKFRKILLLVCTVMLVGVVALTGFFWLQKPSEKFIPPEQIIFRNRVSDFYEEIIYLRTVGDTFAFVAKKDGKYFLVNDGKEDQRRFDEIIQVEVLGEEIAFVARKGTEWFVVYEGQEFGPYAPNVVFSSDEIGTGKFPLLVYDPQNPSRFIFFDRWPGKGGSKSSPPGPSAVVFDGVHRVIYDDDVHGYPHLLSFGWHAEKGVEKDLEFILYDDGYGLKYKGKELVIEVDPGSYIYVSSDVKGYEDYEDLGGKLLVAIKVDSTIDRMAVWKED